MRRKRAIAGAAMLASLGAVSAAHGASTSFELVSHDVQVDKVAQSATFTLTFNQAPDFQSNAFQYEVDAAWAGMDGPPLDFNSITTVIRGSEIAAANALPIRDRDGDGGAGAGGWGPIRDLVPFTVQDNKLTFTTDLSDIGDSDGVFRYRLFTTDSGNVTSDVRGVAIPLPPGVAAGFFTLGGMGFVRQLTRRRR